MNNVAACIAVLALIAVPSPALTWGGPGHRIVAELALARLTQVSPATAESVREILGNTTIGDAAVWPDTLRDVPGFENTFPWHFVDIPKEVDDYDPARDCKRESGPACTVGAQPTCGDCVVAAIERSKRDLRSPQTKPKARREALMFLIHFVGDLHQPLHCADDGDAGGNLKAVCFFGSCWSTTGSSRGKNNNLHSTWDSYMIAHQKLRDHLGDDEYVERLDQRIGELSAEALDEREAGTLVSWAEQSHEDARAHAYQLPARITKWNPIKKKSFRYYPLGEAYFTANIGIVDERLMTAAIRLAKVLRDSLD